MIRNRGKVVSFGSGGFQPPLVRCQDLKFGLCATASESSETQWLHFVEAIEEHWVTEDGHPVAPEYLEWTTH